MPIFLLKTFFISEFDDLKKANLCVALTTKLELFNLPTLQAHKKNLLLDVLTNVTQKVNLRDLELLARVTFSSEAFFVIRTGSRGKMRSSRFRWSCFFSVFCARCLTRWSGKKWSPPTWAPWPTWTRPCVRQSSTQCTTWWQRYKRNSQHHCGYPQLAKGVVVLVQY